MKSIRKSVLALVAGAVVTLCATAATIIPSGSVSPTNVTYPGSTTFQRAGYCEAGVNWTEATLWYPQGGYTVLGNRYASNALTAQSIASSGLPRNGTYSIQFRLVDNNIDYQDQWITFNVTGISSGGHD